MERIAPLVFPILALQMIRAIQLVFLLACCGLSSAQQFELLYDYNNFSNEGSTIKATNNGYIITHPATDITEMRLTTLVSGFNFEGQLEWNVSLTDTSNLYTQLRPNFNIIPIPNQDTYFIASNYTIALPNHTVPCLMKYTSSGEALDTIYINAISAYSVKIVGGIYTQFGIYLIGNIDLYNPSTDLILIKCDTGGNYVWHQNFNQGLVSAPLFIADGGSGILVGGFYYETVNDQTNDYTKQFISRFRYNDGLRLWTSVYSVPQYACYGAVNTVNLPNSNFLFMGNTRAGGGRQPLLGEINRINGDTIWTRTYLHPDTTNWPHNFKRLSNGDYLVVGEAYYDVIPEGWFGVDNVAFMMRLDSGYNLLWKHIYYPEDYAQADWSNAYCRLNDFIENDDGSITALGMVFTYTGDGPQSGFVQDSYLIRVDSEGCNEVGIARLEQTNELNIYPNPANEQLNIQFPHIDKWQVSIYNMQGASVREESANQLLQYSVNIQELPSGIYTVLCKDHKGMVLSEKVVKQ